MRARFFFATLLTAPVILFSCQQEPDETVPPTAPGSSTGCRVTKGYYYDNSGPDDDSAFYTYTGNKLTKVQFLDNDYFTPTYDGNKITRRDFYKDLGVSIWHDTYDTIAYNADGTIKKWEHYTFDPASTSVNLLKTFDFFYTSGKLTKVMVTEDQGASDFIYTTEFQYTGNNITKAHTYYPGVEDSVTYIYDSNPNYFVKQSPQFLVSDVFYKDFLEPKDLPLFISQNNVIKMYDYPDPALFTTVTYTADTKGNMLTMSNDGQVVLRYFYQCP